AAEPGAFPAPPAVSTACEGGGPMSRTRPAGNWHQEIQAIEAAILATLTLRAQPALAGGLGRDLDARLKRLRRAKARYEAGGPGGARASLSAALDGLRPDGRR